MDEAIKITGLREAQKALYDYSQKLGDFVVRKSLRAGINIIKKAAQASAPVSKHGNPKLGARPGNLKRGIRVARSKIHRGRSSRDLIGVYLTVAKKKPTDPFYGRFQEDGWNTRGKMNDERQHGRVAFLRTRRSIGSSRVTQRGKTDVPGLKFIDRAYLEKRGEATEMVVRTSIAAADLLAVKLGL